MEAALILEEISDRLFEDEPAREPWLITAYKPCRTRSVAPSRVAGWIKRASSRASEIHARQRPIVETAIPMHYLAELPDVPVRVWVADGVGA